MESLLEFARHFRWSVEALFADPATTRITGGLFVCVVAAVGWTARSNHQTSARGIFWQLLSGLCPLGSLALGVAFACEHCGPAVSMDQAIRHPDAIWATNALFFVQMIGAGWLIYRARGMRALATAVQAILLWWSVWAGFIAGMSLSGDWI